MPDKSQAIDAEEREFRFWLRGVERRAILPLKWAILITALVFWILSRPNAWPMPVPVFALFVFYSMWNLGQSYFLYLSHIGLGQVRPLCVASYCVDVVFVTLLVLLDSRVYPSYEGASTDFYVFYFLLILRGFALFRTARANLMANTVIGVIFITSVMWQEAAVSPHEARNNMIRIVFVWLVILMSWFIVEIISRQKAEILRARENLVRSENLAVLGQLAAGVAHEINNPIGIISAYAEFLKRGADPSDPRIGDFETIHRESQRCKQIVEELLNYARPASPASESADMAELNNEVLNFLFHRADTNKVRVERVFADALPPVRMDRNQIKQALLNIYMNARDALGENGGTIRVELETDPERAVVRQRVSDTGCGIKSEDISRVFDPFFTTRHTGTGLGLSITRRIIEAHGGSIAISSKPGQGTTVEISLPVAESEEV
ncbi:MAG: ATP-binding protein [Candidatus Sumerlaeaceae bacterium]|nr:ATP-binding protein [Candidatus Sumerlaeaceae bacterium]